MKSKITGFKFWWLPALVALMAALASFSSQSPQVAQAANGESIIRMGIDAENGVPFNGRVTSDPSGWSIELVPTKDINRKGKSHTVTATVRFQGIPQPSEPVNFEVTNGPNKGVSGVCNPGSCTTPPGDGEVTFTYDSDKTGIDTIEACMGLDPFLCVENHKKWVSGEKHRQRGKDGKK